MEKNTPNVLLTLYWANKAKRLLDASLGGKTLERRNLEESHSSVSLLLGIFLVVNLAVETNADAVGDAANTLAPDKLVDGGVKTNVLGV